MKNGFSLNKHPLGYMEAHPKPSAAELQRHYRDTYYQQDHSSYTKKYTDEELQYFDSEARLCHATVQRYASVSNSLLDIGCGEGFFARYFFDRNWTVSCVDYSQDGIARHNPSILPNFEQSDLLDYLGRLREINSTFGLLNLDNVLEHVIDPEALLVALRSIMSAHSVARIEVPNDFSDFQNYLVGEQCTDAFWISPPEHLSYFNKTSLVGLLEHVGFRILSLQADFPIEQFLLNENANYWKDPARGPSAHYTRVMCTNYLVSKDVDRYIDYREAAADLEFGRLLTAYITC